MQPRFEAVYNPGSADQYAEWHVVEWMIDAQGERQGRVVERFGDCSGALARAEAGLLQQAYNREFYDNFG